MARQKSPLLIIFIIVFLDLVGFGMIIPLLPVYAKTFAATELQIGLLVAIYSAVQFAAGPILGRISDRVGRRPVLLVSLLGTAAGFFIMGLAGSLWMLFLARIIDGFSGGNISTAQAYIADVTTPEKRSKGMGLIGAAFGLGFVFGPAIGGLLSKYSVAAPFYFAGSLAIVNTIAAFFLLPESLPPEKRSSVSVRISKAEAWKNVGSPKLRNIMASYFVAIFGFSVLTTALPLITAVHFKFTQENNGYLFACVGIIGACIQGGMIGRLSTKFGDRPLATIGALVMSVGFFLTPAGQGFGMLFFAIGLVAIGNSLITPTLNSLASKSATPEWQGSVLGLMQSAGSLGRTIGPALCGWLLTLNVHDGASAYGRIACWAAAGLMLASMVLTLSIPGKTVSAEATGAA